MSSEVIHAENMDDNTCAILLENMVMPDGSVKLKIRYTIFDFSWSPQDVI